MQSFIQSRNGVSLAQRSHQGLARQPACAAGRLRATRPRNGVVVNARSEPSVQLGTALIPGACDIPTFSNSIYQWATTLTQSGANYPFVLPLKTDKLDNGFCISLLKRSSNNAFDAAGMIEATVEPVDGKGDVLFIRFYEGPAAAVERRTNAPDNDQVRLQALLDSLVDVPTIMQSMPNAIRNAVVFSRS